MTPLALTRIAEAVGGRVVGGDHARDVLIDAVSTDTRALDPADGRGVLFIALRGERFDGHDHAPAAAEAGARALLVSRPLDVALPQIVVADTERALAALAAALHRSRQGRAKVLAVTGSNGKTSVKTLLLSILERCGKAYGNPGNRNNEIGLPLAVIDAPDDADFVVYEMGAGKPGDIAYLTAVARPDVSLVNNIAPAHLERMGSLLGVADTKAAIYDALPNGGTAVINADDAFAPYFAERAHGRRLVRFGIDSTADVVARDIRPDGEGTRFNMETPQGAIDVTLALPGRHNVRNALAAAAMAMAVGATLEQVREGLAAATPVAGRLVARTLPGGATIVDDSYNANPGSLLAAIELLGSGPQAGWLVLGDMRELGEDAAALHAEAGRRARAAGIARLYALGELSAHAARGFGEDGRVFSDHAALADALRADLARHPDVRVLVKGSRGSRMDRIVTALLADGSPTDGRPAEKRGESHDAA